MCHPYMFYPSVSDTDVPYECVFHTDMHFMTIFHIYMCVCVICVCVNTDAASLKAYLEHQREVDTDDTMQSYISEMEQRGTTSSNLLVDHCCKHGCDWQTFIDLCK